MENTNSTPTIASTVNSIVDLFVNAVTEAVIAKLDERLLRVESVTLDTARKLDDGGSVIVQLNAQAKVLERFDTRIDKVETITAQAMSKADVEAYCADEDFVKRADVEDIVTDQLPDFDDLVGERLPDMDDYLQTSDLESELENVHVPVADSDVQTAVENVIGDLLAKLRITRI